MRYGLRRQLLLNLGLVMLLSSFLLSLLVIRVARVRFLRDRYRHLQVVSHLVQQAVLSRLSARWDNRRQPVEGVLALSLDAKEISRPIAGVVMHMDGRIWRKFGKPPKRISKALQIWLAGKREATWKASELGQRKMLDRFILLRAGFRPVGVLWLRWDLSTMEREFFAYQALLFLYLVLFCLLILLVLLFFLERRMVRPLRRLGEAFVRFASGRSNENLEQEVVRGDEIGDLARSFLEMGQILRQQAAEREASIEELRAANVSLERAQEELLSREKMATIGRMAAGVAHEVGNPLSAIMGYSELLTGTKEWGEMEQDLVERIHRETKRIDRIIRDLLDYARPVSTKEPGIPGRAIHEAVELVRMQKRFGEMQVALDVQADLPLVELDSSRLLQVLINLLINAADACKRQGHIQIRARRDDTAQMIHIWVSDDGPGVAETDPTRLFEPFFTTKEPGEGIGLGLALCHRWLQSAGGSITLLPAKETQSSGDKVDKEGAPAATPTEETKTPAAPLRSEREADTEHVANPQEEQERLPGATFLLRIPFAC